MYKIFKKYTQYSTLNLLKFSNNVHSVVYSIYKNFKKDLITPSKFNSLQFFPLKFCFVLSIPFSSFFLF